MFTVTVKSDTDSYTEKYDELIDAANVFSMECGGEELTSVVDEDWAAGGHCIGDGNEVAEDYELFGALTVEVPECNYKATLS